MKHFSKYTVTNRNGVITIENEFVRWEHDSANGGELSGAYVKNGTNRNLLTAPQSTALCPWVRGGWRQYHHYETVNSAAATLNYEINKDGSATVRYSSDFIDSDGKILNGASVMHDVLYHTSGAAEHCVTITLQRDMDLGFISIGTLCIRDDMDRLAVRPCSQASWAVELQNPCQWINLTHAKSRSDLPAYRSRYLPLSILFTKNGTEAIEMSMGDDLGAWDGIGNEFPGLAQGSVYEARDPWRYEAVFAPLDSPRAGNIIKAGTYRFTYRIALPYVKKNILPLSIAGTFLRTGKFEKRWPEADFIEKLKECNVEMLRLHNDGDIHANGIFWRDVSYPPYPANEMAKMDKAISNANSAGIDVVPYFSCKEWHPDVGDFDAIGEKCARRVVDGEKFMETFFGTSLFGIQMCLKSDWLGIRQASIEKTLDNHAFNGLYYDWCMGLECINKNHNCGKRHWDNDRLLDLMEWSRQKVGDRGKLYLHLTNVPNLAVENLGNMILVEESEYFEIFPEMFTPQVHFLNIAPRSICVMLPHSSLTPDRLRALALAALLHHATLCVGDSLSDMSVLKFYKERKPQFDALTIFTKHSAPGEGVASTGGSRDVGISVYWNDTEAMALIANLTDQPQNAEWTVLLNGEKYTGKTQVPPLEFILIPINLNQKRP